MANNNTTLSKTITFLRFPLIVAVVFLHTRFESVVANITEGQFPIYDLFRHIITNEFTRIAVPLFFFISGFLFFYKTDFTLHTYGQKLKRRVLSLLIPYLFWNTLIFLLVLFTQLYIPSISPERDKLIVDYDWLDWLNLFWAEEGGTPICYQFWFMRDLMAVSLLTPILFYFIKYSKVYGELVLGILWLLGLWFSVPGFGITAFFFFSFGAWFSINGRDFTKNFKPMRWKATLIYIMLVTVNTWIWYNHITNTAFLHNMGIVVGLIAVISWTAYGIDSNRIHSNMLLVGSSFFIYAYHGVTLQVSMRFWVKLFSPMSEWTMLAGYFLLPLLITALGIAFYAFLRKCFPTFTAIITGGR